MPKDLHYQIKEPIQGRSIHTVNAILEATTYILIEDGYAKLTTNKIAERAGVNIASLYQYFSNKEAILMRLRQQHVEETRSLIREILTTKESTKNIESLISRLIERFIASHSYNFKLHQVFSEEARHLFNSNYQEEGYTEYLKAIEAVVREHGYEEKEAKEFSWIAQLIIHTVVHHAIRSRIDEVTSGRLAKKLEKMLLAYFD